MQMAPEDLYEGSTVQTTQTASSPPVCRAKVTHQDYPGFVGQGEGADEETAMSKAFWDLGAKLYAEGIE